jgi:hypothetical protein
MVERPAMSASMASASPSALVAPPVVNDCATEDEARARTSLADAAKAAAAKDWATALKSYDSAVSALGACTGPLKARSLGERGYAKLRAKDLDGASVDLTGARDVAADDDLLGAIHFNLALLADAKSNSDEAFKETALSLGFRPNGVVRARLSRPCGIVKGEEETAGVRYASVRDACKALGKSCDRDASTPTALCGDAIGLPCVAEGSDGSGSPWPDELPGGVPVGAASGSLYLVDQADGDALWVYPAGVRISLRRRRRSPGEDFRLGDHGHVYGQHGGYRCRHVVCSGIRRWLVCSDLDQAPYDGGLVQHGGQKRSTRVPVALELEPEEL